VCSRLISGIISHLGHGYSSVVFVVSCVGSGLCDGLTTRSEEREREREIVCVCVCVCVCV